MSGRLGSWRRRRERSKRSLEKRRSVTESSRTLPRDPVTFCADWLGYEPYRYMWPFLRDESHFIANLQARQTGKTFNGMAKLLYLAFRYPGSNILVTAPKYDQVKNIAFKALHQHLRRLKRIDGEFYEYAVGRRNLLKTVVRFRNGSQIRAESPVPETIRGHTAKAVYLMECNFIRDSFDLYTAVLFTLNTTNGYLIAESTPWNTDNVFYRMYHDPAYHNFSTHKVDYTQALPPQGPLSSDIVQIIKDQLAGDPVRWKREMLCQWTEDTETWLPTSLITLAQDNNIRYHSLEERLRGTFYVGVDFGKKRDHSVVAVVEAIGVHKYLRHMHQFPLDTPYGAVIGYLKRLQDSWSRIVSIYADRTGVGEYIVEDMKRGGLRYVTGINFSDTSKEAMATALKENMRTAECPVCDWKGFVDTERGEWTTYCPEECTDEFENKVGIRPLLHIPYDLDLYAELNVERYELGKTGKLHYNHPEGTHDDRFWALALAVFASETTQNSLSKPVARII